MELVDRGEFRVTAVGASYPGGVSRHRLDLVFDFLWAVRKIYSVFVTLGHLPAVDSGDLREFGQERLRFGKDLTVEVVEPPCDFPGYLEVRHLVDTDRDVFSPVDDDVSGLKQRVSEEALGRQVSVLQLLLLFLVSGHPLKPTERSDHREEQMEFGMLEDP